MFFHKKHVFVRSILPLLAANVFISAAQAETTEASLDTVNVTANRAVSKSSLAPTTVITRAEIDRLQPTSLPELLSHQPGIDVTSQGGAGKPSSVFMRGTSSKQVLVLVDGVKWGSATLGSSAFQDFPVDQIERIEIVRGPRSGLYGSEAIGGVIQIFTRQGKQGFTPYGKISYGTHNSKQGSVGVRGGSKDTQYNVNFSHEDTDGINATDSSNYGYNPDKDGYRNNSISAQLSHQFSDNLKVGANIFRADSNNHFDSGLTSNDYNNDVQQVLGAYTNWQVTNKWETKLNLGESRDQSETFGSSHSDFRTRHRDLSWLNTIDVTDAHKVLLGVDLADDYVDSTTKYDEDSRYNRAVYASWQANVQQSSWVISGRHDDNEAFGDANTGSIDYGYHLPNNLVLSANVGTAFKAPTFNDLYYPGYANPNLDPEKSKSFGAGISQQASWANWSINAYQNNIDDLIASDSHYIPQNIKKAKIQGIEFDVKSNFAGWLVGANASLLNPKDDQTGKTLARRAKQLANVTVDKAFGDFSAGASWKLRGHSYDDAANTTKLGGYGLLDLRASYQLKKDWFAKVSLNNVLDKSYQTTNTYNSLDRTVMVTLSYQP